MAKKPGNSGGVLDKLCRDVLRKTKARAAVLVIINDGPRLSATEEFRTAGKKQELACLPKILRRIAKELDCGGSV